MKGYSRFAKHSSIVLTLLLALAWLYYYLSLYAYLPDHHWANSFLLFVKLLLSVIPILILLLLFSLLWIRKPRFRRLNTNISVYLTILFLLNLALSIYNSHHYTVTGCFVVTNLTQENTSCFVTISEEDTPTKLHCKLSDYRGLTTGESYTIRYLGNDLLKQTPPMILQIDSTP